MDVRMKEDVGVMQCDHPSAEETVVRVPFQLDNRVVMPFTIMECGNCGAAYATDEQRNKNASVYNSKWKAYSHIMSEGDTNVFV